MNVQPVNPIQFHALGPAAAAPQAQEAVAGNFYQQTSAALMALPPIFRAPLGVVRNTREATEGELLRVTDPECSYAEYDSSSVRLKSDITELRGARDALQGNLAAANMPEVALLETAEARLQLCLDRLNNEFSIRSIGHQLRQNNRSLSLLLDEADQCWRGKQLRRNPVAPGGAPQRANGLQRVSPQVMNEIEPLFQQTLEADNLQTAINGLGGLTFELAGRGRASNPFAAWFLSRCVLSAFKVGPRAIEITGQTIERLQRNHQNDRQGWKDAFSQAVTPAFDMGSFTQVVGSIVSGDEQAFSQLPNAVRVASGLAPFAPLPNATAQALPQVPDDPAWEDVSTPPASPR